MEEMLLSLLFFLDWIVKVRDDVVEEYTGELVDTRVLHTHSSQVVQEFVFSDAHQMRQRGIPKIRACAVCDVFMKAKDIEQVRERLLKVLL